MAGLRPHCDDRPERSSDGHCEDEGYCLHIASSPLTILRPS